MVPAAGGGIQEACTEPTLSFVVLNIKEAQERRAATGQHGRRSREGAEWHWTAQSEVLDVWE